jgi:hypothetical protein
MQQSDANALIGIRDFRLPLRCWWQLRSSGVLRSVHPRGCYAASTPGVLRSVHPGGVTQRPPPGVLRSVHSRGCYAASIPGGVTQRPLPGVLRSVHHRGCYAASTPGVLRSVHPRGCYAASTPGGVTQRPPQKGADLILIGILFSFHFVKLHKIQSNSVITSWKGLNILCRYKRALL